MEKSNDKRSAPTSKKSIILRTLRKGGPVSGQVLADAMHISRTAVWKIISELQAAGYRIVAEKRGYVLKQNGQPDLMTAFEIESRLNTSWAGHHIKAYDTLEGSTNSILKHMAEDGAPEGTLVVADVQLGGRGRRGRDWICDSAGGGIAMSLLLRPDFHAPKAAPAALISALATSAALKRTIPPLKDIIKIKWPNDILVGGRKACGILNEMSTEEDRISYMITGIGINVNNTQMPPGLEKTATSPAIVTGKTWTRSIIIAAVLDEFEKYYGIFQSEGFGALKDEYVENLAGMGRTVRILESGGESAGTITGVTEDGALLVKEADGDVRGLLSGEISIRGTEDKW